MCLIRQGCCCIGLLAFLPGVLLRSLGFKLFRDGYSYVAPFWWKVGVSHSFVQDGATCVVSCVGGYVYTYSNVTWKLYISKKKQRKATDEFSFRVSTVRWRRYYAFVTTKPLYQTEVRPAAHAQVPFQKHVLLCVASFFRVMMLWKEIWWYSNTKISWMNVRIARAMTISSCKRGWRNILVLLVSWILCTMMLNTLFSRF